jgi:hypothetical protein
LSAADDNQLAIAICQVIALTDPPARITLMNHDANSAAVVIGAVVERCEAEGLPLVEVSVDAGLATELGLADGDVLPHGARPKLAVVDGLGRDVLFQRA